MKNFLISGYGRSGTTFLSTLMNTSHIWTVLHEPAGYFDEKSYPSETGQAPQSTVMRFNKNNYGEVNSMLCYWFLHINVKKRGLIFREPIDIWLSIANRKHENEFLYYSNNLLEQYQMFNKYLQDDKNIHIIRFDKMVSCINYCQNILTEFDITDVPVTNDVLSTKVNKTEHYKYTNMNVFDKEIKLNIEKTTEIYYKIILNEKN